MSKVMLVEDDENLREIYSARLQAEGFEIVSAADGEQALASVVKEKPDLIILDIMMPKISGFDVLDILRTTPETKDTKVIMMTALSQEADRKRGESLGANRYLVKSQVTLEDVVNTVHEVLEDKPVAPPSSPSQPAVTPTPNVQAPTPTAAGSTAQASTPGVVAPDLERTQDASDPSTMSSSQVSGAQTTAFVPGHPSAERPSQSSTNLPDNAAGSQARSIGPKPEAGNDVTPPPARTKPAGTQNSSTPVALATHVEIKDARHVAPQPRTQAPPVKETSAYPSDKPTYRPIVTSPPEKPQQSTNAPKTSTRNPRPQPQLQQTPLAPKPAPQTTSEPTETQLTPKKTQRLHLDLPKPSDPVSASHKKRVIEPINDPTQKPDLLDLAKRELASEQAVEQANQGGLTETTQAEKQEIENQIKSYVSEDTSSSYQERQQQMSPGQTIAPGTPEPTNNNQNNESDNTQQQFNPEDIAL